MACFELLFTPTHISNSQLSTSDCAKQVGKVCAGGDIRDYVDTKFCYLNALHLIIGTIGKLLGYQYVHELLREEPGMLGFVLAHAREKDPVLTHAPPEYVQEMKEKVPSRLLDENVPDTCHRLCKDFLARVVLFDVAYDLKLLEQGHSIVYAARGHAALRQLYKQPKDARGQVCSKTMYSIARGVWPVCESICHHVWFKHNMHSTSWCHDGCKRMLNTCISMATMQDRNRLPFAT